MSRKRILIVDDSSTARMMEQVLLGRAGYDFIIAENGQQAIDKASAEHPDLILMDVVMPQLDGVEACRQLRGRDETRAIPIVMVSTRGEEPALERAFAAGCSDYLPKPINATDLLSMVKRYLGE
jgi:CheY-like chemotaxis protein